MLGFCLICESHEIKGLRTLMVLQSAVVETVDTEHRVHLIYNTTGDIMACYAVRF